MRLAERAHKASTPSDLWISLGLFNSRSAKPLPPEVCLFALFAWANVQWLGKASCSPIIHALFLPISAYDGTQRLPNPWPGVQECVRVGHHGGMILDLNDVILAFVASS